MAEKKKKDELSKYERFDLFRRFDELDDEIIVAELQQKATDVMVYHFTPKGAKEVWGLSKAGVDACVENLAKQGVAIRDVSVDHSVDPTNPEYVLIKAKVEKALVSGDETGREATLDAAIGTKRQWIMIKLRSGDTVENAFWYEQGTQKALRNARLRLIPEEIKASMIAYAKKHKQVQKIKEEQLKNKSRQKTTDAENEEIDLRAEFPDEAAEKEEVLADKPSAETLMNIIRLEATLVDKYGFKPDQVATELKNRFKESDTRFMDKETAEAVAEFLEETKRHMEAKTKKTNAAKK